jgi:hypothetical protein
MIIILSPAKTFNEKPGDYPFIPTLPGFPDDSQKLVNTLRKQSVKSLERLMAVNRHIAEINKERFEQWQLPFTRENANPACYLFRGEVYIGLDATTLTLSEMEFAQDHLKILSGLYGLLRLWDLMQPYRLEMGTKLKIGRAKDLYEYWGDKLANALLKSLESHSSKIIINLASEQYFLSLHSQSLKIPVITPTFQEERAGTLKSIHVYAKRARGLMARYIIRHRLEAPEDIKAFAVDGYRFSPQHSNGDEWVFVRPMTGPKTQQ